MTLMDGGVGAWRGWVRFPQACPLLLLLLLPLLLLLSLLLLLLSLRLVLLLLLLFLIVGLEDQLHREEASAGLRVLWVLGFWGVGV